MYKKWNNDERRAQVAERRWLEMYAGPSKISGQYIYQIPDHVLAGVGGFKSLDKHPRHSSDDS